MPAPQPSPMVLMPELRLVDRLESALPLEHTLVTIQITGAIALVAVTQRFGNPLREPAELEYLFPLPAEAAITGFSLQVGSRRIQGDLQEREAARNTYEQARGQGARAGLFEQRRENLFAVRLANVQPEETIQATLRYQQQIAFEDDPLGGAYEFIFPMGITPKYDSPAHPDEGEGVHAPVARGEPVGPVEIELAVDAGFSVREVSSPSHPIETRWLDSGPDESGGRRFQVRVVGEQIPDHDFVLRYAPVAAEAQLAGWTSGAPDDEQSAGQGYFLATLLPPALEEDPQTPPREFIFVLDRSGSMSGAPIKQARNALRACLRVLNPEDAFHILLFDNTLEWFRQEPSMVTQEQVEQADAFLNRVEGRGGTEIVQALEAALALPADHSRARFVVFLTDGAVSAEARVLERIRAKLGQARLFTFGIGPSVNRALLSRMAGLGRGRASFLQLEEDIEGAIIRFQDSVSFPALTDLSLQIEGGKVWDVYPAQLPDLYYGQPLEIRGRMARTRGAAPRLTLKAMRGGQPLHITLDLPAPTTQDRAVERLWAQARVADLFEQMALEPRRAEKLRAEILSLALEHNLVTALTSFVAVDQKTDAVSGSARVIQVAQPLPQGLYPDAFSPFAPMLSGTAALTGPATNFPPGVVLASAFVDQRRQSPGMGGLLSRHSIQEGGKLDAADVEMDLPGAGGEAVLRWLARTQNLNGSWREDVEWTAAALLAFTRSGHTTRTGAYRQLVRRAARWLEQNAAAGLPDLARALALYELASAAGGGDPASQPDLGSLAQAGRVPEVIRSLEDLRRAALLRKKLAVPPELLQGAEAELARIWAAALEA